MRRSSFKWVFTIAIVSIMALTILIYFGTGSHLGPRPGALYKILPDDLYARHFRVGQPRYFTRGALHCESEQAIKTYHDYVNAENIIGIARLMMMGECAYAKNEKTPVVIETLRGMFIRVRVRDGAEEKRLWMPTLELAYENQ